MLNPCKAKIWFVIELCEPIQPSTIELANFELFSSTPKELTIHGSDRFPTREWTSLGAFTAADERNLQRFDIKSQPEFLKFIKIEMLSHYGSEHFCPLSLVRAFGTSLVEEFDAIESGANGKDGTREEDLDSLDLGLIEEPVGKEKSTQNLLLTAREAVISMVRKAAQVLSKGSGDEALNDAVIAKQFAIHQKALNVMSKVEPTLKRADCIKFSRNFSESNSTDVSRPCLYLESLLGLQLYQVLCDELLREPDLRFKCELLRPTASVGGTSSEAKPITPVSSVTEAPQAPLATIEAPIATENTETGSKEPKSETNDSIIPTISVLEAVKLNLNSGFASKLQSLLEVVPTPVGKLTRETATAIVMPPEPVADLGDITKASDNNKTDKEGSDEAAKSDSNLTQAAPITTQPATNPNNPVLPGVPLLNTNGAASTVLAASSSKESIFIKLNNRIKALELNMSVNSLALEELNLRYREQMLEIQRAFNLTEEKFIESTRKADEKDFAQQQVISALETKLQEVSEKVDLLVAEKVNFHWQLVQIHIILMVIEITLIVIIASFCVRRMSRIVETSTPPSNSDLLSLRDSTSRLSPFKRPNPGGVNIFDTHRDTHSPAKALRLEHANGGK